MSNENPQSNGSQRTTAQLQQRIQELEATVARLQAERAAPAAPASAPASDAALPYMDIFEHLPVPMVLFRADGTMVGMNLANERMLGIPRDKAIGNYNILRDPEAAAQGYADSVRRALDGTVDHMPLRSFDTGHSEVESPGEGRTVWTETTHFPLRDTSGAVQYIGAVNLDVSTHIEMANALQHSENRFRTIVENVPSGICITNLHGVFEYVNRAYCGIYGYSEEELIGQPFTIVVPPGQHRQAQELHDTFMEQRKEIPADWIVVNKAGEQLNILASAAYLDGADGQPRKVTFVLDISDRKRAEAEQARLQQQIIDAQQATVRELQTPLIPITDEVVIMPLIGSIDDQRAQQILEALLEGVAHHQASMVILDITGVQSINTQVANALVQAASAVQLLGTRLMITGIKPQIAHMLVELGIDLKTITTYGTLQNGIAAALGQKR